MHKLLRVLVAASAAALFILPTGSASVRAADTAPVPKAQCGPGSMPETAAQGRVPKADVDSGRAAKGYTCNMEVISHYGATGGFRVYRYTDPAGHECAFYDTAVLFPTNAPYVLTGADRTTGVYVLDMSDPAHPVHTATLLTLAMESPHESLSLNVPRGLLAADMGSPTTNPGFVDIYDVKADCRHPILKSSLPLGILGHEGTFSPDGNTFWVSGTGGHTLTALDVSDPALPKILNIDNRWLGHGLNISDDGNRLYLADIADSKGQAGLVILDVSQIQQRVPNPKVPVVSQLTWPDVSIPQTNLPVTIGGHPYLVEVDEFTRQVSNSPTAPVGGARIIDVADEQHPSVVSTIKLEVNTTAARAGDQAKDSPQANYVGYTAHYCSVPARADPGVVACTFVDSGMRLFDIRDPFHPKEIAYANFPGPFYTLAFDAPAFVPERGEVWFSEGYGGFYAMKVTNGVWPFGQQTSVLAQSATRPAAVPAAPAPAPSSRPAAAPTAAPGRLAATGPTMPAGAGVALVALALALRRARVASRA